MNMHYDLARTEIASRLHHAEARRSAKQARTQLRPGSTSRWQRFRAT
jgi:hypothetical protein